MIYRLTGIVHFAYGELVALGVFTTLLVAAGTGPVTRRPRTGRASCSRSSSGSRVCVAAGAGSYLFAVQPYLARGSTIGWVAAIVAVAFAIRAVLSAVFTRPSYVFPDPLPFRNLGNDGFVTIGGASIQVRSFFVIAVAIALAALARLGARAHARRARACRRSPRTPRARASSASPSTRLVAVAFGLAGGLAAIAAIVAAPSGAVDVDTGALLGSRGSSRRCVVRFGSPLRAMAAGLVLGVVEATIANAHIGRFELGPSYREVAAARARPPARRAAARRCEAVEELE